MSRNSNDDRCDSMNPNNDAYHHSMDNHSNQFNPNKHAYDDRMNNRSNQINLNRDSYQGYSDDEEHAEDERRNSNPPQTNPPRNFYCLEIERMLCKEFAIEKSQLIFSKTQGPPHIVDPRFYYHGIVLYPHIPAGVLRLNIMQGDDKAGLVVDYHGLIHLYRFDTHESFYLQRVLIHVEHLIRKFTAKTIVNFIDENPAPGNLDAFVPILKNEYDMYKSVLEKCPWTEDQQKLLMQEYLDKLRSMALLIHNCDGDSSKWVRDYSESYKEILVNS